MSKGQRSKDYVKAVMNKAASGTHRLLNAVYDIEITPNLTLILALSLILSPLLAIVLALTLTLTLTLTLARKLKLKLKP